jgi:hypothetical protein
MKNYILFLALLVSEFGYSQCITASYGVFPAAAFTNSSCNGTNQNITTSGWAGEYSVVNVTAGNTYVFSSSTATDFITIATTVPAAIVWGTTPVSWTATFTGQVRFYNHTNSSCGEQNSSRTRRVSCTAPAPVNDLCADATPLPCGTANLAGTTVGTTSVAHGSGCTMSNNGVWYSFVGDGQITTISTTGTGGFDQEMAIASGSCGSLTNIACRDANGGNGTESHTFTTIVGVTYFVYVAHYAAGSTTGTFTISRTCTPPLANDLCADATPLPCGTTNLAGTTVNSTSVAHGSGCTMSNNGVWYSFVGDGQITTISTTGTGGFDQEMAIASGSCGSLTNIACRDVGASNGTETHTFTTTVGVTYYVYVAYYTTGATTGTFTISRTCTPPPPPPANDLCADATPLPCGTTNLAGTTNGASNIAHGTGCGISNYGVWYSFIGDGQITTISSTSAGFDHEMAIVMGSCGSFTNIACIDNTTSTTGTESYAFSTANGTPYYIYIAHTTSGGTTTGNFSISRTCTAPTNADCLGATQICNDQTFSGNSGGFGNIQEITNMTTAGCREECTIFDWFWGCLATGPSPEHQTSWYYFQATQNGTVGFTIQTTVDYDFAIYTGNCTQLGPPVRCTFSDIEGNTGLGNGATDFSESATGDSWLAPLDVTTGQFYILMIDNFTADATPFTIDFSLSTPDLLNCNPVPLPVELVTFNAGCEEEKITLSWSTASEINSQSFTLQNSRDGIDWFDIETVGANIHSSVTQEYSQTYKKSDLKGEFFKLKQTDINGLEEELRIIKSECKITSEGISILPNPNNGDFNIQIESNSILNNTNLIVMDLTGKIIYSKEIDIKTGVNSISMVLEDKKPGAYLVSLPENSDKFKPVKFIVK